MKPSASQVKLLKAGLFFFSVSGTFALFAYLPLIAQLVPGYQVPGYRVPGHPASTTMPAQGSSIAPSSISVKSSPQLSPFTRPFPVQDSHHPSQERSLL
ncbi:MAG TPA: hypothetical protein V6C65_26080 [Allocoleopsis sp.]